MKRERRIRICIVSIFVCMLIVSGGVISHERKPALAFVWVAALYIAGVKEDARLTTILAACLLCYDLAVWLLCK